MESLGIVFLYIICPILGLVLAIIGFVDDKPKNKKKIIVGVALLLVPLIHLLLIEAYQNNYENSVVRAYSIKGEREVVLTLNKDKTFEIKKCDKLDKYGKGTWTVVQSDFLQIILKLDKDKNQDIYFEVNNSGNVELTSDGFDHGGDVDGDSDLKLEMIVSEDLRSK